MIVCRYGAMDGSDCSNSPGGAIESAGISRSSITDVAFDANGNVTGFTLAVGAQFEPVRWADNNTATYKEDEKSRDTNLIKQNLTGMFYGVTPEGVAWANEASACCDGVVVVHKFADGTMRVQGIQYTGATPLPVWDFSSQRALVFTGTDHSTLEGKPMTSATINSGARYHSPFLADSFTWDDLLAL